MKFHDTLNDKIWDIENDNQILPEVKDKLEEIASAFIEYLEIPQDAILDKVITGSSASYNYNNFSDLDLHIIVDYDKIHEDCPLVEGYLGALKNTFNKEHDIYIHGIPVELYAEKKDQGTVHNGLYSLNSGWVDFPEKIAPTDNDAAVEAKFNEIKEMVDKCDDSETATELLEKIYTMRKAGLASSGEFCTENLAFKKLRNEGCMDKLREIKKKDIDKQLSLESYNEGLREPTGELAVFAKRRFSNVNGKPEKDFNAETGYRLSLEDAEKWINKDIGYDRPGIIYQIRDKEGNILKEVKWTDIYNTEEHYDKAIKYLYEYGSMEQIAYVLRLANPDIPQEKIDNKIEELKQAKDQEWEKRNHMYFDGALWQNESIKEEFFVGNDKYIIVPVSYIDKDIRILDKKTGEFLKDENGDNLKFATEEECGNYIKSLNESIIEKLNKVLKETEDKDLKTIWNEEMKRDPVIDTPDGPVYLQPSEDGKSIEFGTMTNNGMIVDGSVEYDFDYSLDTNLDTVYDEIRDYYELYLVPEEDRDQVVTDEKEDRLNSLFTEAAEGIYDPRTILKAYNIEKAWIEKMEHTVGGVTQVLLFIINDYKQILDTHAVDKKDIYTYEPKENEYYLDRIRDTGDVITDYNLEPAQKLVNTWNESRKWEDVATLTDKVDKAHDDLKDLIKSLSNKIEEALSEPIEIGTRVGTPDGQVTGTVKEVNTVTKEVKIETDEVPGKPKEEKTFKIDQLDNIIKEALQ